MPSSELATKPWANAALAHSRLFQFDDAELIAREAILRAPSEPNFFLILLYALRRTGRHVDAVALVPRAAALASASSGHHPGAGAACLCSCFYSLAQAGQHAEVIGLAAEHAQSLDPNMHAIIAMSYVSLGDHAAAVSAFARANDASSAPHVVEPPRRAVVDHAAAVLALGGPEPSSTRALAAIERARAACYYEWHWIACDPNLRAIHDEPRFIELISTIDIKLPATPKPRS